MLLTKLIEELKNAASAAELETASFGFPSDRIEIKSVHFGDEHRGHAGEVLHPDEYIKRITRLHHQSWIVGPIRRVIELLELHAKTIESAEQLVKALNDVNLEKLTSQLERIADRLNG